MSKTTALPNVQFHYIPNLCKNPAIRTKLVLLVSRGGREKIIPKVTAPSHPSPFMTAGMIVWIENGGIFCIIINDIVASFISVWNRRRQELIFSSVAVFVQQLRAQKFKGVLVWFGGSNVSGKGAFHWESLNMGHYGSDNISHLVSWSGLWHRP